MTATTRFHLAFPVHVLDASRAFYVHGRGSSAGRRDQTRIDCDLDGHQIVAHLCEAQPGGSSRIKAVNGHNSVDGDQVPVPHYGIILSMDEWHRVAERVRDAGISFVIEPHVRFARRVGEQATMFFRDPGGNALEFKALADAGQIFAR